jgi:hypothetical protein
MVLHLARSQGHIDNDTLLSVRLLTFSTSHHFSTVQGHCENFLILWTTLLKKTPVLPILLILLFRNPSIINLIIPEEHTIDENSPD